MKGVAFIGNRRIGHIDIPDPAPGPGEVVIEVRASGLCGSDLTYYRSATGRAGKIADEGNGEPVIAGHEPAGVVVAIGAGVSPYQARIGDRVMVHHYSGCCACESCRQGWTQMCSQMPIRIYGVNEHGAHAPYLKVPAVTLVPLPEALSFEAGAAISCGTGTAWQALRRLDLSAGDSVAVFGQGPVGLAATQLAVAMGARVIALDIEPSRLVQARAFGAGALVDAGAPDAVEQIRDLTHGGVTASIDTSGVDSARAAAAQALGPWGKLALVGVGGALNVAITDLFRKQATVFASWTFSTVGQAECARFVAERGVPVDAVFTHRWTLAEAETAYQKFDRRETGKAVFVS